MDGPISPSLALNILGEETQIFTNKDHSNLKKKIMIFFSSPYQCYDTIIALLKCDYLNWFHR